MKRWQQILLQVGASATQVFNLWGGIIPTKYQLPIALGIGSIQVIAGAAQAHFNPDGTPATEPYQKP
jgi:hypothetical protein